MTLLLLSFFAVVMAGVSLAGYWLVLAGRAALPPNPRESATLWLGRLGMIFPAVRDDPVFRRSLSAAGYRWATAGPVFQGLTSAGIASLAIAGLGMALILNSGFISGLILVVCGAGCGYLLPSIIVARMAVERSKRIAEALPTALDLLVLGIEAGQSLDQCIADASRELQRTYRDLADELFHVSAALKAGTTRADVFRDLADRNRSIELRKLTSLLLDSDRFGVTLGPALRTHAQYLRIRRKQAAQETARKVSVKLIFPVFFLIFPSVLLVTLGPAVIQIMVALLPMMNSD